jgi:hypothetical protein
MPLWPLRSRQPKLQDEALADLAEMFLSNRDDPAPGCESVFCFPLARVGKYLENGAEDSVRVFAQAIIARAREGA